MNKLIKILLTLTATNIYAYDLHCEQTTTRELKECSNFLYQHFDKVMNEEYKNTVQLLKTQRLAKFKNAQREWLAYRNNICGKTLEEERDGQEAEITELGCLITTTKAQILNIYFIKTGVGVTASDWAFLSQQPQEKNETPTSKETYSSMTKNLSWMKFEKSTCSPSNKITDESEIECINRIRLTNIAITHGIQ